MLYIFRHFSNSLKESRTVHLGFQWDWASSKLHGAAAPLMRRAWELGVGDDLRGQLIAYNMDDCKAAAIVAKALLRVGDESESGLNKVNARRIFGSSVSANLRKIRQCDARIPRRSIKATYWNFFRRSEGLRADRQDS